MDIILDTDLGSDCDDAMALAYLIYAQKHLGVNIKAVTLSHHDWKDCAPAVRSFFRYFCADQVPVGKMAGGPICDDNYCKAISTSFAEKEDHSEPDEAVKVLRKALSESSDCILCAIGPLTNVAALLESKADEISVLDGRSLVKERCSKIVLMAGEFNIDANGKARPEWNVKLDVSASKKVMELAPVETVLLPFDVGEGMMSGKPLMDKYGENNPVSLAFLTYPWIDKQSGRHSWDPATLVYAVEGVKDFFVESEAGKITVDDFGGTYFEPCEKGLHKYLQLKENNGLSIQMCKDECAAYINDCAMKVSENK